MNEPHLEHQTPIQKLAKYVEDLKPGSFITIKTLLSKMEEFAPQAFADSSDDLVKEILSATVPRLKKGSAFKIDQDLSPEQADLIGQLLPLGTVLGLVPPVIPTVVKNAIQHLKFGHILWFPNVDNPVMAHKVNVTLTPSAIKEIMATVLHPFTVLISKHFNEASALAVVEKLHPRGILQMPEDIVPNVAKRVVRGLRAPQRLDLNTSMPHELVKDLFRELPDGCGTCIIDKITPEFARLISYLPQSRYLWIQGNMPAASSEELVSHLPSNCTLKTFQNVPLAQREKLKRIWQDSSAKRVVEDKKRNGRGNTHMFRHIESQKNSESKPPEEASPLPSSSVGQPPSQR